MLRIVSNPCKSAEWCAPAVYSRQCLSIGDVLPVCIYIYVQPVYVCVGKEQYVT